MVLISGVNTGEAEALTAVEKALGAPKVQTPEEEAKGRLLKPVMDEYIPEEPQEPSGRYWMGKNEDGQPKIYFDKAEEPKQVDEGTELLERTGGESEEQYACNTDKVDREIEKLKQKQAELEQQLNTETDEVKIKELERQLSQVEREWKQKDNDTYRKQHATFTQHF